MYKTFLEAWQRNPFQNRWWRAVWRSLEYFEQSGYEILYLTRDLHASDVTDNIETEHEKNVLRRGHKNQVSYCKTKAWQPINKEREGFLWRFKKLISALVLGSMLVGLSGCNITDFSAENLLRLLRQSEMRLKLNSLLPKRLTAVIRWNILKTENSAVQSSWPTLTGTTATRLLHFFATVPKLLRFICLSCTQKTIRGKLRPTISLKPPNITALTLRI